MVRLVDVGSKIIVTCHLRAKLTKRNVMSHRQSSWFVLEQKGKAPKLQRTVAGMGKMLATGAPHANGPL